jgi:predicted SAM-dependent methyltransferase
MISFLIRNRKFQLLGKDFSSKEYLNCGCGLNIKEAFINLDWQWRRGVDLCWDITRKLPLSHSSIKGIYMEHVLEHISFPKVVPLLGELRRVLKKDGAVRIVVPDAELYLDLYQSAKQGEKVTFPYDKKDLNSTPLMHVNELFRGYGHQYAYDFQTLRVLLNQVGFLNVTRHSFNQGRDPALLIDTEWRNRESLYVEAVI